MATNIGKAYVQLSVDNAKLINGVAQANKSLGTLELAAKRLQSNLIGMFGSYQLIGGIQHAVTTLAEFDKVMTQVSVITGSDKLSSGFDRLEKSALRLGSTTQYTAKEVAGLQLEFGRLGFSTREILQSTEATVNLATATGEGLARSAEIAGSTLRAFNLDASEMVRVTDVMAASLNESALTLDTFADAIKYVAPVAAASNVSIEETAAMMSVLADAGIKGTQAGTSLRRIFTLLTDTGKPLQQRLEELAKAGITLAQANDEVGLYAQTALLVLTEYKDRMDKLTLAYIDAGGETKKMATAMQDNLGTSITKVSTAYDALILSLRGGNGVLKSTADYIAEILRGAATAKGGLLAIAINPASIGTVVERMRQVGIEAEKSAQETKKLEDQISDFAKGYVEEFGDNIQAIAKNIDSSIQTSIYKNEILAEVHELLKKRIEDQAKALVDKTTQQIEDNKSTEKAIELARELSEVERQARIAKLERQQAGETLSPFDAFKKVSSIGSKDLNSNIDASGINSMTRAYDNLSKAIQRTGFNLNFLSEEQSKQIDSITFWGSSISNVIDNVIAKDMDFKRSLAETTGRIIDEAKERIAWSIAEGAARALALGPKGIAAAAAIVSIGLSLVSGVLKRFAKTSDVNTRASTPSSSGSVNYGTQSSVVIRGQDLYVAMKNYEANNKYTKAGG